MKKWILYLSLTSSLSFANNRTLTESIAKTLPAAVSDAALLDLPLCATLYGLDILSPEKVGLCACSAVVGYGIRKACNDFLYDGEHSAVCGFLGGSIKYTGASYLAGGLTPAEPILGAIDAGTYEGTAKHRGDYPTAEFVAIETVVSGVGYLIKLPVTKKPFQRADFLSALKSGAATGVLVSLFVHTSIPWYSEKLEATIANAFSELANFLFGEKEIDIPGEL